MYIPSLRISESVDGSDALAKIAQTTPDVVFMDVRLPGRNGLQLAREIKELHPNIVVSIFTNYDLPEYRKVAMQCGADHFLLKDTLSGAEIAGIVKAVVAKNKASAPKPVRNSRTFIRKNFDRSMQLSAC
jgi:YesN/AraC family two-component response regulator